MLSCIMRYKNVRIAAARTENLRIAISGLKSLMLVQHASKGELSRLRSRFVIALSRRFNVMHVLRDRHGNILHLRYHV